MRHLSAWLAALVLPLAQPLLIGSLGSAMALLALPAPGQGQSAEAVARVAEAITVRIEGATQGSGVLVKRDGNRYTLLTAWHVVSGQRPGEELDIYTADGQRHALEQGSISRLADVDLAQLSFSSANAYQLARLGDMASLSIGGQIYVAGFPLPTSAVPLRAMRFVDGRLIANATAAIPNGYQLLYTNPVQTLPGMSGGAVLDAQGRLVGIHASAERADQISDSSGKAVATGANQGVPILYYSRHASGTVPLAASARVSTVDNDLARAQALIGLKNRQQEIINLANRVLVAQQSADAYFYRAYAKYDLGDKEGAIADYDNVIAVEPQYAAAYHNRGRARQDLGDKQGAIADYGRAIAVSPRYAVAYVSRGVVRYELDDKRGSIVDYSQAIALDSQYADAYFNRAISRHDLKDYRGAIDDYAQAIVINPQLGDAYRGRGIAYEDVGNLAAACRDWRRAASLGDADAGDWVNRQCR